MNMTGTVYRPPYEANSLLLQVTLGCSHNKCTFCYMYPDVKFTVCPMEQIESDIEEAAKYYPDVERVFLEHGDAFVLSADKLSQIATAIHRKLPKVKTIAMYASIQNIKHKTDDELRRLCNLGIGGLDIGVESGLEAALTYMNKSHTAEEAKEQLLRLTKAGISYSYSFNAILGCGGADLWHENADATADLINAVQPHLLFIGTLHAQTGCRLYSDMKTGAFKECTTGQLLDEQERLISRLDLKDTIYFGSHQILRKDRALSQAQFHNQMPDPVITGVVAASGLDFHFRSRGFQKAKPFAANGLNTGIARTKGAVDGFDIIADCTLRDVQPTCKFGSGQKTGAVFQNMEELSLTVRKLYRFGRLFHRRLRIYFICRSFQARESEVLRRRQVLRRQGKRADSVR